MESKSVLCFPGGLGMGHNGVRIRSLMACQQFPSIDPSVSGIALSVSELFQGERLDIDWLIWGVGVRGAGWGLGGGCLLKRENCSFFTTSDERFWWQSLQRRDLWGLAVFKVGDTALLQPPPLSLSHTPHPPPPTLYPSGKDSKEKK